VRPSLDLIFSRRGSDDGRRGFAWWISYFMVKWWGLQARRMLVMDGWWIWGWCHLRGGSFGRDIVLGRTSKAMDAIRFWYGVFVSQVGWQNARIFIIEANDSLEVLDTQFVLLPITISRVYSHTYLTAFPNTSNILKTKYPYYNRWAWGHPTTPRKHLSYSHERIRLAP